MDCHILSAAHNATITGPKCRVCAAFTIEMRQSVGIEILIISFPRGPRAALQLGKEGDVRILRPFRSRKKRQDETSNSLVSTPISEWLFKKKRRIESNTVGRDLCRCLRFWFICLLFTMGETGKHGTRVTSDSPLETRWWEDGSGARQRCSPPPCPKVSASVVLIVRHPLALFR